MKMKMYLPLGKLCARAGLVPVRLASPEIRAKGRPNGSQDTYPRAAIPRLENVPRLREHAAIMRERFGAVEEYEKERWGE
jgi:hypothetical protein